MYAILTSFYLTSSFRVVIMLLVVITLKIFIFHSLSSTFQKIFEIAYNNKCNVKGVVNKEAI